MVLVPFLWRSVILRKTSSRTRSRGSSEEKIALNSNLVPPVGQVEHTDSTQNQPVQFHGQALFFGQLPIFPPEPVGVVEKRKRFQFTAMLVVVPVPLVGNLLVERFAVTRFLVQPVLVAGNRLPSNLSPLSVVIETFDEFLRFENPLAAAVKVGFYLGNILGEHLLFLVFAAFSLPDDDIGDAVFLPNIVAPQMTKLVFPNAYHGVESAGAVTVRFADPAAAGEFAAMAQGLFDFFQRDAHRFAHGSQVAMDGGAVLPCAFRWLA